MLNKILRTSAFRLTLLYAAIFCASFIALFAAIYWSTAFYMDRQLDDTVSSELAEIQSDAAGKDVGYLQALVENLTRSSPGFFYLLQDSRQNVLAGNLSSLDPRVGIVDRLRIEVQGRTQLLRGRGVRLPNGHFLFVALSTFELHKMQTAIARTFIWGLGATIFISLCSGAIISLVMLARVEALGRISREIVNGDLTRRIPLRGSNDEFDRLAISLNTMFDRIEGLVEGLRQVSSDIAHDLRTPLTRLRQRIETSLRKAEDVNSLRVAFEAALIDVDSILSTFGALLRIAQLEASDRRTHFATVDLSEVLRTAVELYVPMAEERAQTITEIIDEELTVRGDKELLLQLFANLVENAVRHSGDGAAIRIETVIRDGGVAVLIADNGPGIPPEHRIRVFQRFFRLDASRTTPGSGLGLSLVKAIATLHEMSIELLSNEPGLLVLVRFQPRMANIGANQSNANLTATPM
jgi:signal transduction histidine kinase